VPHDPANLELSVERMRALASAVLERSIAHVASLGSQPSCGSLDADDLCRSLRGPAPADPADFEPLLDRLFGEWIPRSFTTSGPGYLAYVPGGGIFSAALADFVSDTTNRFTGIFPAAPVLVELESITLGWLREWMGFPSAARGLFTTGGSSANLQAIFCAREKLLGTRLRDGVLYTSDQAHHSILKSARIAGVLPDRVRTIASDASFRIRIDRLEEAIARDRAAGLLPFCVVSNAGTTNTGAVDPLPAVGAICRRDGLWHHVDGAYGAFFHAVPSLRPLLPGLAEADSLTLDPHKGLFLPYGTGCLLVRDGDDLRAANGVVVGYLPSPAGAEFYDPGQYGPDLSRGYPGLRVWMTFQLFGANALLAAIAEKRELALGAANRMSTIPGIRIPAPPELSLFPFRLEPEGSSPEEADEATKSLVGAVTGRGRVMISGCTAKGRAWGRVCVLSFRTRQERIDALVEDVAAEAARIGRG
jgi:aromatic-L-amino-acid decarboxylase